MSIFDEKKKDAGWGEHDTTKTWIPDTVTTRKGLV